MSVTKYPLYNSKNQLIGNCSLDNVYNGDMGKNDPVIICEDLNGNAYEIGAWSISRIINFSDPTMPRTYGRTS